MAELRTANTQMEAADENIVDIKQEVVEIEYTPNYNEDHDTKNELPINTENYDSKKESIKIEQEKFEIEYTPNYNENHGTKNEIICRNISEVKQEIVEPGNGSSLEGKSECSDVPARSLLHSMRHAFLEKCNLNKEEDIQQNGCFEISARQPGRKRVSYEQRKKMIEFMVAHPDFARNRVAGTDAARKKKKLQAELTILLNSCAIGATKSTDKWIRDWRSDVKIKAAKIRRAQQKTAGSRPSPLSTMEKAVLTFVSHEAAKGIAVADTLEVKPESDEQENGGLLVADIEMQFRDEPCIQKLCKDDPDSLVQDDNCEINEDCSSSDAKEPASTENETIYTPQRLTNLKSKSVYTASQKLLLKGSQNINIEEKKFQCSVCAKRYNLKANLEKHIMTHTGKKCSVCEKIFINKSTLKRHLVVHTGDKPYQCEVCERRFNHKSSLQLHLNTHAGDKPYQCPVCDKRFNYLGLLKRHLSTRRHYSAVTSSAMLRD